MKLRTLITAVSIAALPLTAGAATFIVPAAGTGAGANRSQWQSELTLHNTSAAPVTVTLAFHDANGTQSGNSVTVAARATTSIEDIVASQFGRQSGTGAIEVDVPDASANKIAITSRTFNSSSSGQYGQDVPAVNVTNAAGAGSVVVLQAPSSATQARFNFGLYAVTDATVQWQLVRADGTLLTPIADQTYTAGTQMQFGNGIKLLLGLDEQDNDTVQAVVTSGSIIGYGSSIDNTSGDPTFVPGIAARQDIALNFAGVDLRENGTINVTDSDHDGVLDQPIDMFTTTGYPNYFRVVVTGPNGDPATLQIVSPTQDIQLIDAETVLYAPSSLLKGTSGKIVIQATADGQTALLTIPVNYR